MRPLSIAGLQIELYRRDNREEVASEILSAKKQFPWVDMILLAELCMFGTDTACASQYAGAEAVLRETARKAGVWLVAGSLFQDVGGKIFNTCPVIDPDGRVVARYRKMYPFLPYERGVASGTECCVFEFPGVGKIGLSICYDMWFPETLRTMTWMGAEVILHPSMTNTIDRDAETAIARASAAMHQIYFFDLNIVGMGGGRSGVYGPGGEIVHAAGTGREIIAVELDLDYVAHVRDRGWHGLAQVLKSFRDADHAFPPYEEGAAASEAFRNLGPMHFHHSARADRVPQDERSAPKHWSAPQPGEAKSKA